MASTTVRIQTQTRDALRELAGRTGEPLQSVLARAVEVYRRQLLLDEANVAYAALRGDEAAWKEEVAERAAWEATLADGLGGEAARGPSR